MNLSTKQSVLLISTVLVMLWGCLIGVPKASSKRTDFKTDLLRRLTSVQEAERFKVLDTAIRRIGVIDSQDLETALVSLHKKNMSTLIYTYIKTKNNLLYDLSPPAKMALENSEGSFPNIAYYYARVKPDTGIKELYRIYQKYPQRRMAICKAIGEVSSEDAHTFLLTKIRAEKESGNSILEHLSGLKSSFKSISDTDLEWILDQNLDREELIALSELDIQLKQNQLKEFWMLGGGKRFFVVQNVLQKPMKNFKALRWVINQYLKAGETETVRQILQSDGMRTISDPRIVVYRDEILKKLR